MKTRLRQRVYYFSACHNSVNLLVRESRANVRTSTGDDCLAFRVLRTNHAPGHDHLDPDICGAVIIDLHGGLFLLRNDAVRRFFIPKQLHLRSLGGGKDPTRCNDGLVHIRGRLRMSNGGRSADNRECSNRGDCESSEPRIFSIP